MNVRTRRALVPRVGGLTAAATGAAAMGPVAHLATAGAEQSGASLPMGTAGVTGAGAFESCSAYFGFGKGEGVLGLVEFDVADVNGADPADHAVPADTGVVLVLENTEGALLECTPFEVTEQQWIDEFEEVPELPGYPGPGHYAYPSVNFHPILDGFGEVSRRDSGWSRSPASTPWSPRRAPTRSRSCSSIPTRCSSAPWSTRGSST